MKITLDIDRAMDELSDNKYSNLLISPASLTTVLAIVLLGSAGKTFDEVTKALYFDFDKDVYKNSEKFHKTLGDTIMDYNEKQNKMLPIYELATGLFIQVRFFKLTKEAISIKFNSTGRFTFISLHDYHVAAIKCLIPAFSLPRYRMATQSMTNSN